MKKEKEIITFMNILTVISILSACSFYSPINDMVPATTQSPVVVVSTFVSDSNYLIECKNINPSRRHDQVEYNGIYPGKTNVDELVKIFGLPIRHYVYPQSEEWVYDDFLLIVVDKKVTDIYPVTSSGTSKSLVEFINLYGCPDIILASTSDVEPNGYYDRVIFLYYEIGLSLIFYHIPVKLTDLPDSMQIFKSLSQIDFLASISRNYPTYNSGKPLLWSEAVK